MVEPKKVPAAFYRTAGGCAARVILCFAGQYLVLLHGFVKKTQTTPRHDLALAMKRRREVMA